MNRELSLRVIFAGIDKLTAPLRNIGGASKIAAGDLRSTRKEITQLQQSTAKIGAFRDLQRQIGDADTKMEQARQTIGALTSQIEHTDGPVKRLNNNLNSAKKNLEKLGEANQKRTAELQALEKELTDAGLDVRNLATAEEELGRRTADSNRRLEEQQDRLKRLQGFEARAKKLDAAGEKLQSNGTKMAAAGAAVVVPVAMVASPAIEFESSIADVRKVVTATTPEFDALTSQIKDLSRQVPMSPNAIAGIVAAGARAGVARTDLIGFARDAAKMGVAFETTAEDAGQTMATWRTAFKLTQPEVVALADRANALTNAFGGDVKGVTEMMTKIGPLGRVSGVAAPSLAAMAQLLNRVGVQSDVGATGMKNMMLALSKGGELAKGQKQAFASIGLSAEDVARRMQVDSKGTILDVLTRVSKLDPSQQTGKLDSLFGSESIAAIAPLLTNLDNLKRNFGLVGDQAQWAGSMTAEFESRSKTSANKLQLVSNQVDIMKITLGAKLLPTLIKAAEWLGGVADKVTAFADRHPRLTKMMLIALGALGAMLVVFGTLAVTLGLILGPIGRVIKTFRLLREAGGGLSVLRSGGSTLLKLGRDALTMGRNAVVAVGQWMAMTARLVAGKIAAAGAALVNIGRDALAMGRNAVVAAGQWMAMTARLMAGKIAAVGSSLLNIGRDALKMGRNALIAAGQWSVMAGRLVIGRLAAMGGVLLSIGRAALVMGANVMRAGLMMLANPMVLIVVAIVAAIALAAYAIYSNWDKIKAAFAAGVAIVTQAWEWIKSKFNQGVTFLKGIGDQMLSIGSSIVKQLANGITSAPGAVWDALKSVVMRGITSVRDLVGLGPGAKPATPRPNAAPAPVPIAGKRARGGPVGAGRLYLVGEQGPELFEAPTNGRIIPNHNLPNLERARRPLQGAAAIALAAAPMAAAAAPLHVTLNHIVHAPMGERALPAVQQSQRGPAPDLAQLANVLARAIPVRPQPERTTAAIAGASQPAPVPLTAPRPLPIGYDLPVMPRLRQITPPPLLRALMQTMAAVRPVPSAAVPGLADTVRVSPKPLVVRPSEPAFPTPHGSAGGSRPSSPAAPTFNITINVQQRSGEDGEALSRRIAAELEKKTRAAAARRDSSFEDFD